MTELTPERFERLRRIAAAATPGPWEAFGPDYGSGVMQHATGVCAEDEYGDEFDICRAPGERDEEAESADLEYIAEFDPPTVLTLLGELKRLRQERETLAEAVEARGRFAAHLLSCGVCRPIDPCSTGRDLEDEWLVAQDEALALLSTPERGGRSDGGE